MLRQKADASAAYHAFTFRQLQNLHQKAHETGAPFDSDQAHHTVIATMGFVMARLELVSNTAAPTSPQISPEETAAMQRAVVKLFALWSISDDEACTLLGGLSPRTYARWKTGNAGRANVDLQARLSNLLGIHKALRLLFEQPERAYAWIKRPNDDLGGASALEVMLGGQLTDLMYVRRYLDSQRSPW